MGRSQPNFSPKLEPIHRTSLGLDLHRSVLHTDLPAPYCFDCKSATHQERQETTGYIYTLWFQIDKIGIY